MSPCFADLCRRAGKVTSLKPLTLHHFMRPVTAVGNGCQYRSNSKSIICHPLQNMNVRKSEMHVISCVITD